MFQHLNLNPPSSFQLWLHPSTQNPDGGLSDSLFSTPFRHLRVLASFLYVTSSSPLFIYWKMAVVYTNTKLDMLYIIVWLRSRVRAHTSCCKACSCGENVLTVAFIASCRALLQVLILFDFLAVRMRFRLERWLLSLKSAHLVELSWR